MDSSRRFSGLMVSVAAVLAVYSARAAEARTLLDLDFNDSSSLGSQLDSLPAGLLLTDAKASPDFPGSLDLGSSGYVKVPGFKSPAGPFSVEARFRLKDYAPLSTRYISDILNTATWDIGPTQGMALRIGGGYLYAPMPAESYASAQDYQADIAWYDDSERASISKCIGEFLTAMKGNDRAWKEVVTDRCIELDTWVHMVGVWDGEEMRIYLNGQSATDSLRVNGKQAEPYFDTTATAFVGARADGSYDSRHFKGILDYVRVVDSAMGPVDIRRCYRSTQGKAPSDTFCHAVINPEYPTPGQAVGTETIFRFGVVADGACTRPDFHPDLNPEDSVEVEIGCESEFKTILARKVVKGPSFKIEPEDVVALAAYQGAAYWRARIISPASSAALRKSSAFESASEWSLSRPVMMEVTASPVALQKRLRVRNRVLAMSGSVLTVPANGDHVPSLRSLDGARSSIAWVRHGNRWNARVPEGRSSRLLILAWE